MNISIIIPTYHRPQELEDCLRSVSSQTLKPTEVVVVDDGDLGDCPLRRELADAGIHCVYFKKDRPGLTESRNVGVRLAQGEIIFFLDDDVLLFPDYIEQIASVYQQMDQDLAGVGGVADNLPPVRARDYIKLFIEFLFLNNGIRKGRVLPSGYSADFDYSPIEFSKPVRVDFLPGGISSFRRWVFDEFSFTEGYRDIGFGEDKDFTFRVARRYKLLLNPRARLIDVGAPSMRPGCRVWSRKHLIGIYLLFYRHLRRGWWSWLFFWYAVTGDFIIRGTAFVVFPSRSKLDKLKGMVDAIRLIMRRQIPNLGNTGVKDLAYMNIGVAHNVRAK